MISGIIAEYMKMWYENYFIKNYLFKTYSFNWVFSDYFEEFQRCVQVYLDWIDGTFYQLAKSRINIIPEKEKEEINTKLKEFNHLVIKEIYKYKDELQSNSSTEINFNKAAVEWINKYYKDFKKEWFEKNCNDTCLKNYSQ